MLRHLCYLCLKGIPSYLDTLSSHVCMGKEMGSGFKGRGHGKKRTRKYIVWMKILKISQRLKKRSAGLVAPSGKCTQSSVPSAVWRPRFLSSRMASDRCTAGTAIGQREAPGEVALVRVAAPGKCTQSSVPSAAWRPRSPSSRMASDRCTAGTAIRSTDQAAFKAEKVVLRRSWRGFVFPFSCFYPGSCGLAGKALFLCEGHFGVYRPVGRARDYLESFLQRMA